MMKKEYSEEILEEIGKQFPEIEVKVHSPRRVYIRVPRDKLYDLAQSLFKEKKFRLAIATGIDTREGVEILYHFSHDESGTFYNLKTVVPKDDLKIQSLADFLPAANWIEREIHELIGVDFLGHPNLVPLLTAESWPSDLHPLRRDYDDEHEQLESEGRTS
jgi:Ni,Fe-hydrogenase III component G